MYFSAQNLIRLKSAIPTKPLTVVTLSDADNASALSFVKQKLQDLHVDVDFDVHQVSYVERLGGRASDLESVSILHSLDCGGHLIDIFLPNIIADP